jgi:alpha-beta hydrolase superfamily lysophospholipase
MSLVFGLILIFVLFLLSAAFVLLVVGPLILLQPLRRTKEWYRPLTEVLEPVDAGLPQETVMLKTHDGLLLSSWLVAQPKRAQGTVLYLHGVGDCKTAGVPLAKLFHDHGYNVFLYDSRRHGDSEGAYCTYGYYEKFDVSTAINYLHTRLGKKLGAVAVFGTSMGAAIAIQAAAIDTRIKGVIAEASFTDLRTISVDYQRRIIKLPWHFLRNVAMAKSQLRIPILFIHGTSDSFIDFDYSKMLYHKAREPRELFLVPGANHTDVWEVAGRSYETKVLGFLTKALKPARATRKRS